MRRASMPRCRHGCRFIEITSGLFLCPHASWGFTSNLLGAVEEARALLARAGGYDEVLANVVAAEDKRKQDREAKRQNTLERLSATLKYE